MIIFLEGVDGVGKTAYAKELSKQLMWVRYRSFRRGEGRHRQSKIDFLSTIGCPPNSHIDDVYFADFFSSFEIDAVLERSYISALAYDSVYKDVRRKQSTAGFRFWLKQLNEFEHLYVWLEADYKIVKERQTGFSPTKKEYDGLVKVYEKGFKRLPKTKMRICTNSIPIKEGVKKICQRLNK